MIKTLVASVLISGSLSVMAQATVSPSPVVVQIQPQSRDFQDYAIAVIQLLTLIGLVVYVIKTWQIASATKNAASRKRAPAPRKSPLTATPPRVSTEPNQRVRSPLRRAA
jgi:hypothetical protein